MRKLPEYICEHEDIAYRAHYEMIDEAPDLFGGWGVEGDAVYMGILFPPVRQPGEVYRVDHVGRASVIVTPAPKEKP